MALTASERARARERIEGRRETAAAMANRYKWMAISLQAQGAKRGARIARRAADDWGRRALGRRP